MGPVFRRNLTKQEEGQFTRMLCILESIYFPEDEVDSRRL